MIYKTLLACYGQVAVTIPLKCYQKIALISINFIFLRQIYPMTHLLLFSLPDFIMEQFQAHKPAIVLIAIGMVASLLSQLILPGRGFGMLAALGIGIVGAWLGNMFIRDRLTFIEDPFFRTVAGATVGAMILSVIINLIRGGEDRDKTGWRHN
jgi:uncharacterized membrane protein YeaQ/YmgE (transglycosylase-associated protein family)